MLFLLPLHSFGNPLRHLQSATGLWSLTANCLCMVMPHLKKPIPNPPVERPVRGFSDCKEGGSFGALRSLGLVGVALFREDELNGWGELVGVVLVVLAQEKNFVVGLAGACRCSAAAGAGAEGGGVL